MVFFRADGNPIVGLGHIMRDLSIADAFREIGEDCCFLLADNRLSELINNRGYNVEVLNSNYDSMNYELEATIRIIDKESRVSAFIIDSYSVTDYYLSSLHSFCKRHEVVMVYVDDLLSFPYPCDFLLNYNIYASLKEYKKLYKESDEPIFMLGTSFAPLRTEFQGLADKIVRERGSDVLISTGGSDNEHFGIELIKIIIEHPELTDINFHFVIGMMNSDREVFKAIAENEKNILFHYNVKSMSELMQSCDVAISAAGSTLYELCAVQTPTISYILADNQISGAKEFDQMGVVLNAGDIHKCGKKELAKSIIMRTVNLLKDYKGRSLISKKMKEIVDGNGARRIAIQIAKKDPK